MSDYVGPHTKEEVATHLRHAANMLTNAIQHMVLAEGLSGNTINLSHAIERVEIALTLLNGTRLVHLTSNVSPTTKE